MKCINCGAELRETAEFCTECGYPQKDMPKIVLSDQKRRQQRQRALRSFAKLLMCILLAMLLLIGGTFAIAYFSKNNFFLRSPMKTIDNSIYRTSFALIDDVRETDFVDLIDDLNNSKETEKYKDEYTAKFQQLLSDKKAAGGYTDDEKLFVQAAQGVWYVNYKAALYERTVQSGGILEAAYKNDAKHYREYAEEAYKMLKDAKSTKDIQKVKQYLKDNKIPVYD
ncbi:MAG: zinc ribbon domain-containing protein [Oscillospiraceae bacterium]|jgi:hypothetical protein|nr:zinc ribbon domain-containing protein [Oscillospiraceae bacterium]